MIRKRAAINPLTALEPLSANAIKRMTAAALVGGAGGALIGRKVTPKVFKYKGDPAATNLSTLIDASIFAGLGAMAARRGQLAHFMGSPGRIPALVAGISGAELLPMGLASMRQTTAAMSRPTASDKLEKLVKSPMAKGVGAGAAGAGLAGLSSGLMRAPSEREQASGAGRTQMIARDIMKFIAPAMIAGGLGGKLIGQRRPAGPAPAQVAALGAVQPVETKVRG